MENAGGHRAPVGGHGAPVGGHGGPRRPAPAEAAADIQAAPLAGGAAEGGATPGPAEGDIQAAPLAGGAAVVSIPTTDGGQIIVPAGQDEEAKALVQSLNTTDALAALKAGGFTDEAGPASAANTHHMA